MSGRRTTRIGGLALVASLGFCLGVAVSSPANAVSYNRTAAINYAKQYSCNLNESCRNSAYANWGTADCTNFVSQAVRAGGIAFMNPPGDDKLTNWWYSSKSSVAVAWINVTWFNSHFYGRGYTSYLSVSMGSAYTAASMGDVYIYDWGQGNGYSHLSMATAYGQFGSFYDPTARRNYNTITGGEGDKLSQHSSDRDGAPWNWGYQTQRDATIRSKMKTTIIHFKT